MCAALISTKLYFPQARHDTVRRSRLTDRLREGLQNRLTLLSAPAGYGKTTLLGDWATSSGSETPVSWFSIDVADNDPIRFLHYLTAALDGMQTGLVEQTASLLQSPKPLPLEIVLTAIVNNLSNLPSDSVVVLDDYHLVYASAIHEAVAFLIDHMPPSMHLVILTRADPPLPLARLRARGQLTELRAGDLRFTIDETATFLNDVMALNLRIEDATALATRTEGWITGLQLASLSLQGHSDPHQFISDFTGSHRYVVDYLVEEVLNRQPDPIRAFLLQTSILERMTGALCDALTDKPDGQVTLEYLERANLFVVPLDNNRTWYRYHHLFAEVLQQHLLQSQPELVTELHQVAADWFREQGYVAEAIEHALTAGDVATSAQLIGLNAQDMIMQGVDATIGGWLQRLPEEVVRASPDLSLANAWLLMNTGQLDQARTCLEEVVKLATEDPTIRGRHIEGTAAAYRAVLGVLEGDSQTIIEQAQLALEQLPEDNAFLRGMVAWHLGQGHRFAGDIVAAERAFAEAERLNQVLDNFFFFVLSASHRADRLAEMGQLRQAAEAHRKAQQYTSSLCCQPHPLIGDSLVHLGDILREWNELEAAEDYVSRGLELNRQFGLPELVLTGLIALSRVRQARSDWDGAETALQEGVQIAEMYGVPYLLARARSWQTRLWLVTGNLNSAVAYLLDSQLSPTHPVSYAQEDEYATLARILIAQSKAASALGLLERFISQASEGGRWGRVIELHILKALAHRAMGDDEEALNDLELALSRAQPEGYVRIFLDEGASMIDLLRQAGSQGIAPAYVAELLSALAEKNGETAPSSQPLIEPLSERELEVLRLVASGKSNQEVADELVIAPGTVKKHLSNVFGKLNAQNRTQCVACARELRLL